MSLRSTLITLAVAVSAVVAQTTTSVAIDPKATGLDITVPSSADWWVQTQQNLLTWKCRNVPGLGALSVYIQNSDPQVLSGQQAIIANIDNTVCSKLVDATSLKVSTGYTILLTNPVNVTDVYAISEPFEIKAAGAAIASITTTDLGGSSTSSTGSQTGSASGSNPSQTKGTSAAQGRTVPALGLLLAVALAFFL